MSNDDLKARREQAREAMESKDHKEARQMTEAELNLKRHRARLAMESYEQKKRREERERKLADAKAAAEKLAADLKRQQEEEKLRTAEEEARKRAEQEEEEQAKQAHLARIQASEAMITELKQDKSVLLSALRTLESDIQKAVKEDHMSLTQMAIKTEAERRARLAKAQKGSGYQTVLIVGIVLVLILGIGGFAAWYYLYRDMPAVGDTTIEVPSDARVPSIVFAEQHVEIKVDGKSNATLIDQVRKLQRAESKALITNIYFTTSPTGSQTARPILGQREVMKSLGIITPATIFQYISQDFMLGIHRERTTSMFLILTTPHFENAAYSFNQNETEIASRLYPLLTGNPLPGPLMGKSFTGRTIKNIDARVLADESGTTVLLYSFLDRKTIVIAETEEALLRVYQSYVTPDVPVVSEQ